MIVRKLSNNKVVVIDLPYDDQKALEFVERNSFSGYMIVDSLPHSTAFPFYKNYKWENNEIVVDDDANAIGKLKDDIINARKYLNNTDWYIIRKLEEDIDIPEEVVKLRSESKELIRSLESV
jgi:hypothetical protein